MFNTRILLLILIIFSNTFYPVAYSATSDGSGAIYIKSSYKLGVANKVPQATLDINGNILIKDGTQGAGKILKSDSNGLASWQTITGSGNGEWTDIGSALHSNGSPTSESIIIGANSLLSADLIFTNNGAVVINEQASAVNLRIEGDNNDTLLASNGRDDAIGIGLIEAIEKLNINGAIALDALSSSPSATSGYGKVYVNGSILYYKNHLGNEFDLTAGDRGAAGTTSMVQFREDGQFQANGNFTWSDADLRLGLHNTVPDTVLDDNGAFTYRGKKDVRINIKNYTEIVSTGNLTETINKPTGTNNGDLLLAISTLVSNETVNLPGWTLLNNRYYSYHPSYPLGLYVFYKIASSEPADYTISYSNSGVYGNTIIYSLNGVDTSNPIELLTIHNGSFSEGSPQYNYPEINLNSSSKYVRILATSSSSTDWTYSVIGMDSNGYDTHPTVSGYSSGNEVLTLAFKDGSGNISALTDSGFTCPGGCQDYGYISMSLGLNPQGSNIGNTDPKTSLLWFQSNGDTMVKTHNGGELKEFTLIDFQGDPNEKFFNGLTLTSLDPNKLVKTDASKKLVSVNEITLNGFGLIGINNTNPQALLDLNGSMTFINGVDDMLIRDDLEVDGDIYASNLNISGSINANNILANTFQATEFLGGSFNGNFIGNGSNLVGVNLAAGEAGFVQYNNGGKMGASENLFWDDATVRFGLHNTVPDTVLDDNGAFTYRASDLIPPSGNGSEFVQVDREISNINNQTILPRLSNIQEDDLMIISIMAISDSEVSITPPPGWTLLENGSVLKGGSDSISHLNLTVTSALYYKVASGSEPVSYTFNNDGTYCTVDICYSGGIILAYRNVDASNPIVDHGKSIGTYSNSVNAFAPALSSLANNERVVRMITSSAYDEWQLFSDGGYTSRYGISAMHDEFTTGDRLLIGAIPLQYTNDPPCATCDPDEGFVSYSILLRNISSGSGNDDGFGSDDPDPKASLLWLKSNGDTMVKTHNGGELKEFTLIDFQSDPLVYPDREFNGLTLTSLDPNKLVKTDANKKLVSVDEIIIDSGNAGFGLISPNEKLTINGVLSFSEISAPSASSGFGKVYTKTNGLFFKDASGAEYNINSGAAAGSNTELQFNNLGSFGANGNLTWNATHLASSRMLVDNANLASPSYSFITDSDSGIFNSAANNLDFSTGAAEYFSINGSKLSLSETYGFNTLTINGSTAFTSSAAINIMAGAGITVTKALMLIQTSGGTVDITANPQIADGTTDGQIVTLKGASDINRVKLEDGTGLSLSDGVPVYLGLNDTITLMYDFNEDLWIELDRSFK